MLKRKEFIKKYKVGITAGIIIGVVIVGGIVAIGKTRIKMEDFNYGFNDLEEALAKFEELGKKGKPGNVALWYEGMEGYKYLVQDLN